MCYGVDAVAVVLVMSKTLQLLNWFVAQFRNKVVVAIGVAARDRPTLSQRRSQSDIETRNHHRETVRERERQPETPSMMINPIIKFS